MMMKMIKDQSGTDIWKLVEDYMIETKARVSN